MRNAIISVYNKSGISRLGKFLASKGVNILSTGGTFKKLAKDIDPYFLKEVSNEIDFPEILNGRVKTLHPIIHGGILAKKNNQEHFNELITNGIKPIDLVVVNLYPFEDILKQSPDNEDLLLENIDIGGHTLIRSAAKNYKDVIILTDPNDYDIVINNWNNMNLKIKKMLAQKAFRLVTKYDMAISSYFLPNNVYREYELIKKLKYGANPQQKNAGVYINKSFDKLPFEILNGNPGYINILDSIYGWNLVLELSNETKLPTVASFKHNSPAGVAVYKPLTDIEKKMYFIKPNQILSETAIAYLKARNVDPMSSFGDFLAISTIVDEPTAKLIKTEVSDGIIAKGYTDKALEILKKKKKGNYIILKGYSSLSSTEIREMCGITLIQEQNNKTTTLNNLDEKYIVTKNKQLSYNNKLDLIIANITLKYTQSNSVSSSLNGQTLGIGAGQQSRIDCVKLVKRKTFIWLLRQHPKVLNLIDLFNKGLKRVDKINGIVKYINGEYTDNEYSEWLKLFSKKPEPLTDKDKCIFLQKFNNICLASDAFFPFRDNIDESKKFGVKYIIQPGGSVADNIVIDACNSYNMVMALTGKEMRMFLH